MAIDASIYRMFQPPDFAASAQRGFGLGQQMAKDADARTQAGHQAQINDIIRSGFKRNQDGTTSFDSGYVQRQLGGLGGNQLAGTTALSLNQKQVEQDLTQKKYADALKQQDIENQFKRRSLDNDVANRNYLRSFEREKFDLEKEKALRERDRKINSGEDLPIDQKKLVETLSTKNANKLAIQNQIQAVVDNWDSLTEEQRLIQGNQLLKTLNSAEGADAIGVEEARRLGSMLEFQKFNFTQPGAFIGRDLEGFKQQAQNTANNIGAAVKSNQSVVDRAMGRVSQLKQRPSDPIQRDYSAMDDDALEKAYRAAGGK